MEQLLCWDAIYHPGKKPCNERAKYGWACSSGNPSDSWIQALGHIYSIVPVESNPVAWLWDSDIPLAYHLCMITNICIAGMLPIAWASRVSILPWDNLFIHCQYLLLSPRDLPLPPFSVDHEVVRLASLLVLLLLCIIVIWWSLHSRMLFGNLLCRLSCALESLTLLFRRVAIGTLYSTGRLCYTMIMIPFALALHRTAIKF